jgi:hypothetical protein
MPGIHDYMGAPYAPFTDEELGAYYGGAQPAPAPPADAASDYGPPPPPAPAAPPPPTGAQALRGGGMLGRHPGPDPVVNALSQAFSSQDPLFQTPGSPPPAPGGLGPAEPIDPARPEQPGVVPVALAGGGRPGMDYPSGEAQVGPITQTSPVGEEVPKVEDPAQGRSASSSMFAAFGGGGGGGGQARKDLYGTFDREKELMGQLAGVEMDRAAGNARGLHEASEMQRAEAVRREQESAAQGEMLRAYQDQIDLELSAIREQKVDPKAILNDAAPPLMAMVGNLFSGLAGTNSYAERIDKIVEREIRAQENNLARKMQGTQARMSLLGQMRQTYKDENLARAQAKALMLEAHKTEMLAYAATFDSPTIATRAAQGANGVDRQIASLKIDEAAKAAAAAAAAARFREAQLEKEREFKLKVYQAETGRISAVAADKATKKGNDLEGRFVALGTNPDGSAHGVSARDDVSARKLEAKMAASRRIIEQAEEALRLRKEAGITGRVAQYHPAAMVFTPQWKTDVRSIEADLLGAIKEAKELGALDNGVERFAKPMQGKLDSLTGEADDKLNRLIESTKREMETYLRATGGVKATRTAEGDVVRAHGLYAPQNEKGTQGVKREPY